MALNLFQKLDDVIEIIPDGYKIKASAVLDMEELYVEMQRWFTHTGYSWTERKYLVSDQPSGAKLHEISWICTRKVDEYVKYILNVHIKATISVVEVSIEQSKKNMHKGSIEFRFKGDMIKDVEIWKKKMFGKFLRLIYERVLIKKRLNEYEDILENESKALFDEIKEYLGIKE